MEMTQEELEEQAKAYGRIVTRAWSDEAFKQRLLDEPAAALREEGFEVVDGIELRVVENTDDVVYLALQAKPAELTEEDLETIAGGQVGFYGWGGWGAPAPDGSGQPAPGLYGGLGGLGARRIVIR